MIMHITCADVNLYTCTYRDAHSQTQTCGSVEVYIYGYTYTLVHMYPIHTRIHTHAPTSLPYLSSVLIRASLTFFFFRFLTDRLGLRWALRDVPSFKSDILDRPLSLTLPFLGLKLVLLALPLPLLLLLLRLLLRLCSLLLLLVLFALLFTLVTPLALLLLLLSRVVLCLLLLLLLLLKIVS